ncbi:hypothetical protein C8Q80DRAFT_867704 [Daedaleopsis nitida]|nr:hypothetical protein C8Q80DRAFT_867704 [Daedaleopsis nitida]
MVGRYWTASFRTTTLRALVVCSVVIASPCGVGFVTLRSSTQSLVSVIPVAHPNSTFRIDAVRSLNQLTCHESCQFDQIRDLLPGGIEDIIVIALGLSESITYSTFQAFRYHHRRNNLRATNRASSATKTASFVRLVTIIKQYKSAVVRQRNDSKQF